MSAVMRTKIIKIGNSQGVRIPKLLLDQADLGSEVEMIVQEHELVIRPLRARAGWEEQFKLMAERRDDRLLDAEPVSTSRWDEDEWEWK